MRGVTPLYEFMSGGIPWGGIVIAGILALALLAFVVVIIVDAIKGRSIKAANELGASIVALLIICLLISWGLSWEEETHFKVILDDTVPYKAFTEKFDVLEKEGEIYTVRYKDGTSEWIDSTEWFVTDTQED